MSTKESADEYHCLVIEASSPDTEIWLGDDNGYFVQKSVNILDTRLLPGNYVVEFKPGGTTYSIRLDEPRLLTEKQIKSGSSCPRRVVKFFDE